MVGPLKSVRAGVLCLHNRTFLFFQSVHESGDCRYAVYDVQYETSEGGRRGKLAFIHFCPDEAPIKRKVGFLLVKANSRSLIPSFTLQIYVMYFSYDMYIYTTGSRVVIWHILRIAKKKAFSIVHLVSIGPDNKR